MQSEKVFEFGLYFEEVVRIDDLELRGRMESEPPRKLCCIHASQDNALAQSCARESKIAICCLNKGLMLTYRTARL